jgi:hypothetical protein
VTRLFEEEKDTYDSKKPYPFSELHELKLCLSEIQSKMLDFRSKKSVDSEIHEDLDLMVEEGRIISYFPVSYAQDKKLLDSWSFTDLFTSWIFFCRKESNVPSPNNTNNRRRWKEDMVIGGFLGVLDSGKLDTC